MNGIPLYLGIDPGVNGGIAAVDVNGHAVATTRMPDTERETFAFLTNIGVLTLNEDGNTQIRAVLERVHASPQMGVVSAFTFGRGVGVLRMALLAAEIPFDEVTPQAWQKALGCRAGRSRAGGGPGGDKNIGKRRAQELFPSVTVTHAIADALLLAEYCRRTYTEARL